MIQSMEERQWWVDWAKAICIFLMVVGHSFYPEKGSLDWMIKNFIYSFHMPLFFFVSGYLTKYRDEIFSQYLIKQIKSLIVPYFFLNFVCFLICLPIHKLSVDQNRLIETIIGGGHSFAGATWFLLSLFWIKLLSFFVNKRGTIFVVITSVLMVVFVYVCPRHIWFGIPAAILAYPIFSVEYAMRKYDKFISLLRCKKVWIFFVSLIFLLTVNYINASTAMFSLTLGRYPLLYYLEIAIGIIMIVSFSLILENMKLRIINLFSSGSIIIMGTHGGISPFVVFVLNAVGIYSLISANTLLEALMISVIVVTISIPVIIFFQKYLYMMIGNRR